jgi:hypothetical protein
MERQEQWAGSSLYPKKLDQQHSFAPLSPLVGRKFDSADYSLEHRFCPCYSLDRKSGEVALKVGNGDDDRRRLGAVFRSSRGFVWFLSRGADVRTRISGKLCQPLIKKLRLEFTSSEKRIPARQRLSVS